MPFLGCRMGAQFPSAGSSHHQFPAFLNCKLKSNSCRGTSTPAQIHGKMGEEGAAAIPASLLQAEPSQLQFSSSFPGSLNVYLRLKGQTAIENPLWSSSGNKGQHWNQARVNINPPTSFQVRLAPPGTGNSGLGGGTGNTDPFLWDFAALEAAHGQMIALLERHGA